MDGADFEPGCPVPHPNLVTTRLFRSLETVVRIELLKTDVEVSGLSSNVRSD